MSKAATTLDLLLGGRVALRQPARGYRAATDPVFLAAACPARPGDSVLDLGCGVGAAALCLAARVAGLELHGLERDAAAAALARSNGGAAGLTVWEGDVAAPPAALRRRAFDHVIANPPYFPAAATAAEGAARDAARREGAAGLDVWLDAGLRRLRQGGVLCVIHKAERLPEMLAALAGRAGDVAVLPLAARAGRPAGRVVLRARKDSRAPFRLLAPLVVHDGDGHAGDGDDFSPAAAAVLRHAAPLPL